MLFVIVTTIMPRMKNSTASTMANVNNIDASLAVPGFFIDANSRFSSFAASGLSR